MRFQTFLYADISTGFLETSDLNLLATAPNHLAEIDHGTGSIFWISVDPDHFEDFIRKSIDHGMSDRFREIFRALHESKITYVRFDADGWNIQGLDYGSAGKA